MQEIDYLGEIIFGNGLQVDPSKLKSMVEWPMPKNIKSMRGFLGLTRYYIKFIKKYGFIAALLTMLLKKCEFQWS